MIETFLLDNFDNIKQKMNNQDEDFKPKISIMNVIISLIISCGAAYLAYQCNQHENDATRLVFVIIAFLFPGVYLIYFFIRYSILGQSCGGKRSLRNIFKRK